MFDILPRPQRMESNSLGSFVIEDGYKVYSCKQFAQSADLLVKLIKNSCNLELQFTEEITQANIVFDYNENEPAEGYRITVGNGNVTVTAGTDEGAFYAVQSLRQMWSLDFAQEQVTCNACYVEDKPKFGYRGVMIDSCRHMPTVAHIKKVIDLMASVKLNKLHWHLSDDQGFRVQIDKYPLINKVSSYRNGTEIFRDGKRVVDEEVYGGFYTKDEIAEVVEYAKLNKIEVIPEIDLPGHMVAVLAAYPQYSCTGDVTETYKKWGISKDILCAGNEQTYPFICDILDEVADLFPSKYFHLGGDEAPKDRWCNCKLCKQKLADLKLSDYDELQTYMVEQFRKHLENKGKTVICWDDGVTDSASSEIISHKWTPKSKKKSFANSGRRVIVSQYLKLYFDLPYGRVPMSTTCRFNPLAKVRVRARDNVLGVEGPMWSEWIATEEKFFFNFLPRMDALAEVAWGNNRKGNIRKRVENRYKLYDELGLMYNSEAFRHIGRRQRKIITDTFYTKDGNSEFTNSTKYKQYMENKQ